VVICLERGANYFDMVQLMSLPPRHLLLHQNPDWLNILALAYPGCPGKEDVKQVSVRLSPRRAKVPCKCFSQVLSAAAHLPPVVVATPTDG